MRTSCVVVMSVVLATAGWVVAGPAFEEVVDRSFPLARGGTVALENVNGDVSVEVWERDEVRMYAVKGASSPELLEALEIEVNADGKRVSIATHYPQARCSESEDHRYTRVEYTLTVPRSAVLDEIELVNGNLAVVGVEGGIDLNTVNGNIVVRDCLGSATLSTVNGGIEAHCDRLGDGDALDVESVNGSVDLYLASSVGADLRADSVNGRLNNEFGIEVHKGKYVGSNFRGRVGGGGARVDLETVNGTINVHQW